MCREFIVNNKMKTAANVFVLFLIFEKIVEKLGFFGRVEIEGILKDLIVFSVFLINLVVIVVFQKADSECVDKKNRRETIINFILMLIYLELSYYNGDNALLIKISSSLIVFITWSMCYAFSTRVELSKHVIYVIIAGIIGIEFITGFHIYASLDRYNAEEIYEFENASIYKKYKELYEEAEGYVILDYSTDSVYVRELVENNTHYFTFENQEEYTDFVDNQTMGKNVDIPILSYDIDFDDENMTATYFESYYPKTTENMSKNGSLYFFAFGSWYVITSIIGVFREKKKLDI